MAKAKTDLDTEGPGEREEEDFRDFLDSLPAEARAKLQLYRLPSNLTPDLMDKVHLTPPRLGEFDAMVDQVRRMHGVGKYVLHVSLIGADGTRAKYVRPTFSIGDAYGPPGGDPGGGGEYPPDLPAGERAALALEDALQAMSATIRTKSTVAQLRELGKAADDGAETKAPAGGLDTVRLLTELAAVVRGMMPPQENALTVLKNARDILAPAGGTGSVDMVGMVRELVGLARDLGGGEGAPASGWAAVLPHIIEGVKAISPYLPHLAAAVVQARATVQAGPGAPPGGGTVTARPEVPAVTETVPSLDRQKILEAVSGNVGLADGLSTVLQVAYLEASAWSTVRDQDREDVFEDIERISLRRVPGLLERLVAAPPEQAWQYWCLLDPRMGALAEGRAFLDAFVSFLRGPAPEAPAAAPPDKTA